MSYAAYCRVSTEEQSKGDTIQAQIQNIKEYCQRNSIVISEDDWFKDDSISGALPLRDRPEGSRLLLDILEGKITQVLILRVDRLARDEFVAQEIYQLFKKSGVSLTSINEPFDYFEPSGQLMASMFSTFAAYDRAVIRQRFTEGKIRHAREGKFPQGTIPFGYILNKDKRLVVSPDQAKTVKLIYRLYTEEEMSTQAIVDYLNAHRTPSPAHYKGDWYLSRSKYGWCSYSVSKILNTKYYSSGLYPYKPPGEKRISVPIPAIIKMQDFKKARRVAKERKVMSQHSKRIYLLRGLIKCGVCGSSYNGTSCSSKHFYYRCNRRKKLPDNLICNSPGLPAEVIENIIWDEIKSLFSNPKKLAQEISRYLEQETTNPANLDDELYNIKKMQNDLEQEKKKLLDLFAKGIVSEKDISANIEERNRGLKTLQDREKQILKQQQEKQEVVDLGMDLQNIINEIGDIVNSADSEIKQDLFKMLVDKIEVLPSQDNPKIPEVKVAYKINTQILRNNCYLVK
ncbi:MAG: recombinase family protein [Syntrophomonadaceae bacterium]|nr:recombinase family protein [Syntrophomonadaceae bacterium]